MEKAREIDLLKKFKNGLLSVKILNENDFGSERWKKSEKKDFYLLKKENNLFESPKIGVELGTGIEAVRSSAAMIFNTLGQEKLKFKIGDAYVTDFKNFDKPEYEKKLPALKNRNPAHLDAFLKSDDNASAIFLEAKCLEWLNSPKTLHDAYLNPANYLYDTDDCSKKFIDVFNYLTTGKIEKGANGEKRYKPIFKKYDAIQMTIHILGIYNWCKQNKKNPKEINLMNVVWNCEDFEEYRIEEKEGNQYEGFANIVFHKMFEQLEVDLKVEYVPYSDFLGRIDFSNQKERRNYLKRYELKNI